MYSIPFPVSVIRTRMRQEFERHRFVNKLPVVDVLLMQNNAEYQVRGTAPLLPVQHGPRGLGWGKEGECTRAGYATHRRGPHFRGGQKGITRWEADC